ncbi:MAG: tol-pal system protein YbgF [Hyphomonadaceae bacterium]
MAGVMTAAAQTPSGAQAVADAQQDRIEELQRELQQATAQNEQLQHELSAAQREITRLQGIVGDLAAVRDATAPPADAAAADAAAPAEPAPAAASPPQQGTLGTLPATPPAGDASEAYSQARALLAANRLAEAETAFASFLSAYPRAPTAADGRYWYAFTLLAQSNYQGAAQNFLQYLQATPQGPRAPEALVRLGMALGGLGRTTQACAAFRDLPRRYPNAARPVRDLATRESRAQSCPAA